jgi:membrane protein implicated in regulation of membrane protease activity
MIAWIESLAPHWGWLALGLTLAIAEMVAPGYFMIWLAAAALATGFATAALSSELLTVPMQVMLFAVLAAVALVLGRRWLVRNPIDSADPMLNDRGGQLVGETALVTHAIDGGTGRVKCGDSEWLARGPDAQPGTRVRISGHDGVVLIVEHLN